MADQDEVDTGGDAPAAGPHEESRVAVVSPTGVPGTIPASQLQNALERGFRLEAPADTEERRLQAQAEAQGSFQPFAEGVARTATFGTIDWLRGSEAERAAAARRAEGSPFASFAGEGLGLLGPGAGQLIGKAGEAAGGAVLKGAASRRLGQAVVGGSEEGLKAAAGAGGRIGAKVIGGGVEMAGIQVGQGVSELALDKDPVTIERAIGVLGHEAILGFATGAGLGALGGLMGETARYARTKLRTESMAAAGEMPDDVAIMDRPQLDLADKAEKARVVEERRTVGRSIYEDATQFKDWLKGKWFPSKNAEVATVLGKTRGKLMRTIEDPLSIADDPRPLQKTLRGQANLLERYVIPDLENELVNPTARASEPKVKARRPPGWANPSRYPVSGGVPEFDAVDAKRLYRVEAEELRDRGVLEAPRARPAEVTSGAVPEAIPEGRLGEAIPGETPEARPASIVESHFGVPAEEPLRPITKKDKLPPIVVSLADDGRLMVTDGSRRLGAAMLNDGYVLARFEKAPDGAFAGARPFEGPPKSSVNIEAKLQDARDALDVNRAIQARIDSITGPISTARTEAIAARRDELRAFGQQDRTSFARKAARAAAGSTAMGALLGTGMPFTVALMGGMGMSEVAGRMLNPKAGKLAGALTEKVAARRAAGAAAIDSLLSSKAISAAGKAGRAGLAVVESRATRDGIESRREKIEDGVRAQVGIDQTGQPAMLPSARSLLHARLAGLRAVDPGFADLIEQAAVSKVQFLASKLPVGPSSTIFGLGSKWRASDADRRRVERYVTAAEDGDAILERAARGDMTPEDAETMRVLYPKLLEEAKMRVIDRMTYVRELPYQKKIMLSMLFDTPLHDSLHPENIAATQEIYAADAADQASKQQKTPFRPSSMKTPEATQAQQLAEGK